MTKKKVKTKVAPMPPPTDPQAAKRAVRKARRDARRALQAAPQGASAQGVGAGSTAPPAAPTVRPNAGAGPSKPLTVDLARSIVVRHAVDNFVKAMKLAYGESVEQLIVTTAPPSVRVAKKGSVK